MPVNPGNGCSSSNQGGWPAAAPFAHGFSLRDCLTSLLGDDPWFGGTFGYADAAVAPMLNRSVSVALTFAEFEASAARMADTVVAFTTGSKLRKYRDHRLDWMMKSGGIEVVLAGLHDGNIRAPWPRPR